MIILLGSIILVVLIVGVAMLVLRSVGGRKAECPEFLVGRWRLSGKDEFMVFGKGSAGYCEAGGMVETFAFTVRGDRLRVEQNCVVRRYRMSRGGDGVLRLEGKNDTLVLKR